MGGGVAGRGDGMRRRRALRKEPIAGRWARGADRAPPPLQYKEPSAFAQFAVHPVEAALQGPVGHFLVQLVFPVHPIQLALMGFLSSAWAFAGGWQRRRGGVADGATRLHLDACALQPSANAHALRPSPQRTTAVASTSTITRFTTPRAAGAPCTSTWAS